MSSVMVIGAGAVGSYYGALLARADHDVTLIARGPHLAALAHQGVVSVREPDGSLWHATVSAEPAPRADSAPDLAIITTKSHHTLEAARVLGPAVGPETHVLSLQNGVENVVRAEEILGEGRVLAGQAFVGAWIEDPGTVVHGAEGKVSVGDPGGGETERAKALFHLVAPAWDVSLASDIVTDQWKKLLWNAGFNALCAIADCTAGAALALPQGERLVRGAMHEVVALAAAHGVSLTAEDVDEMAQPNPSLVDYRPSTARDLAAGKPLERDALCGFIARSGREHQVPTPLNDTLDALLALREPPQQPSV